VETSQLIWIIIGIVVVLAVIGLLVALGRKRRQAHLEHQKEKSRQQAAEIRQKAQDTELEAREREARAAMADAEAQRAELEAERLRREASERQSDAQSLREETMHHARRADELDPDVDTKRRDSGT
jgi:uncharacterized protein HemX